MFGREFALAVSLIVAPAGSALPDIADEDWLQLQSSLHRVTIDWELLDPREKHFYFKHFNKLEEDIELIRIRVKALRGAPTIADASRFPSQKIAERMLQENRALRDDVNARMVLETDRLSGYRAALYELEEFRKVWVLVRDAKVEFYNVYDRRRMLKRLQEALGDEDYAAAKLPPATPHWRFKP